VFCWDAGRKIITAMHRHAPSSTHGQMAELAQEYARFMARLVRPDLGGPCNSIRRVLVVVIGGSPGRSRHGNEGPEEVVTLEASDCADVVGAAAASCSDVDVVVVSPRKCSMAVPIGAACWSVIFVLFKRCYCERTLRMMVAEWDDSTASSIMIGIWSQEHCTCTLIVLVG
jgi:hypothetical protein